MKRFFIFLLAQLLTIPTAFATPVYMMPDEWAGIVEYEDWPGFIDEYFLSELFINDYDMLMFAQELNISNGEREKWGERYMFGRLESARSMDRRWMELSADDIYYISLELQRLLIGPWLEPGHTEYKIIQAGSRKYNALIGNKWERISNEDLTILMITHYTDRYGSMRRAYLGIVDTGIVGEVLPDLYRYDIYLLRRVNP